jgi:hypothetical protein
LLHIENAKRMPIVTPFYKVRLRNPAKIEDLVLQCPGCNRMHVVLSTVKALIVDMQLRRRRQKSVYALHKLDWHFSDRRLKQRCSYCDTNFAITPFIYDVPTVATNLQLSSTIKFYTDIESGSAIKPLTRKKDGIVYATATMRAAPFGPSKSGQITSTIKSLQQKKQTKNDTNEPTLHQESQYSLLPIVDEMEEMKLEQQRKKLALINKTIKREIDKNKRKRVPLPVVKQFNSNNDLRNMNSIRNALKKKEKGEVTYF